MSVNNNSEELRKLIANVLNNEEACELLRTLLLPNTTPTPVAGPTWYVWCVDLVNRTDGKTYYHPVVTSAEQVPTLEAMMNVDNYIMLADQNQFAVHQWEGLMHMTGRHTMLVAIPDATYQSLKAALKSLVGKILAEAEKMFEPLDNIAALTRGNADGMKLMMLMRIFADMRILFECVDQNMDVHDSSAHNYEEECDDNDCDNCEECDGNCEHCRCTRCYDDEDCEDEDEDEDDEWTD